MQMCMLTVLQLSEVMFLCCGWPLRLIESSFQNRTPVSSRNFVAVVASMGHWVLLVARAQELMRVVFHQVLKQELPEPLTVRGRQARPLVRPGREQGQGLKAFVLVWRSAAAWLSVVLHPRALLLAPPLCFEQPVQPAVRPGWRPASCMKVSEAPQRHHCAVPDPAGCDLERTGAQAWVRPPKIGEIEAAPEAPRVEREAAVQPSRSSPSPQGSRVT